MVVVLGASEDLIRRQCNLNGVSLISNRDWAEGIGTSLARGIHAFDGLPGVLVMTCDMPAVTVAHLLALVSSEQATASFYAGRKGVPAYIPREMFPQLLALKGDTGARQLLQSAAGIELIDGQFDVDTAEDLNRLQEILTWQK